MFWSKKAKKKSNSSEDVSRSVTTKTTKVTMKTTDSQNYEITAKTKINGKTVTKTREEFSASDFNKDFVSSMPKLSLPLGKYESAFAATTSASSSSKTVFKSSFPASSTRTVVEKYESPLGKALEYQSPYRSGSIFDKPERSRTLLDFKTRPLTTSAPPVKSELKKSFFSQKTTSPASTTSMFKLPTSTTTTTVRQPASSTSFLRSSGLRASSERVPTSSSAFLRLPTSTTSTVRPLPTSSATSVRLPTSTTSTVRQPAATTSFLSRPTLTTPATTTSSTKKLQPGVAYIFNQEKFDNPAQEFRVGSAEDVKQLKSVLAQFKVTTKVITNATRRQLLNEVSAIERKDFTKISCLILVILTHGNRHEMIATKDGSCSIDDDILFPVLRNGTLRSKPKILVIQACKGSFDMRGFYQDSTAVRPAGNPSEILKFYSTFEGYVSYRSEKGSIFIQSLCEHLRKHGSQKSIKEIMEMVVIEVKDKTEELQIPTINTNCTKPYVFGDYV